MLTNSLDEFLVETVVTSVPDVRPSHLSRLLTLFGRYRRESRRNNRVLNINHALNPVYEKVPMRVWRRRGAVLMALYEERDRN